MTVCTCRTVQVVEHQNYGDMKLVGNSGSVSVIIIVMTSTSDWHCYID